MQDLINKIHNADCLEFMKEISDKSIDMILCDLPYGTTACKWDTIIPFEPLWEQYKRIIKDNGAIVLTASQPFTTKLISSNFEMFKYCWIWDKISCTGCMLAKKQPMRAYEDILIFYNIQPTYNPIFRDKPKKDIRIANVSVINKSKTHPQRNGYYQFDRRTHPKDKSYPTNVIRINNYGKAYKRIHPTQKPIKLFEYLIKTYTNEGDLVLDNCSGSGTTAIACLGTNRKYICIEKDEVYYQKSLERVEEYNKQLKLF